MKGVAESLAGRADIFDLETLSLVEIRGAAGHRSGGRNRPRRLSGAERQSDHRPGHVLQFVRGYVAGTGRSLAAKQSKQETAILPPPRYLSHVATPQDSPRPQLARSIRCLLIRSSRLPRDRLAHQAIRVRLGNRACWSAAGPRSLIPNDAVDHQGTKAPKNLLSLQLLRNLNLVLEMPRNISSGRVSPKPLPGQGFVVSWRLGGEISGLSFLLTPKSGPSDTRRHPGAVASHLKSASGADFERRAGSVPVLRRGAARGLEAQILSVHPPTDPHSVRAPKSRRRRREAGVDSPRGKGGPK